MVDALVTDLIDRLSGVATPFNPSATISSDAGPAYNARQVGAAARYA